MLTGQSRWRPRWSGRQGFFVLGNDRIELSTRSFRGARVEPTFEVHFPSFELVRFALYTRLHPPLLSFDVMRAHAM